MLFLLRPPATAFTPPQTVWFLSSTQRQACAGTEQVPVTIFHVLLDRSPKSHTSAEGLCKEPHPGSMHPTPPTVARGWRPDRHTDAGLPGCARRRWIALSPAHRCMHEARNRQYGATCV